MPIDPSIYGKLATPQPMDIGSMISTARGALQLEGESSLGDIYHQATNPDGTVDAGKLGRLAPSAGVLAPQVAEQAQARAQGQQVIDRNKMDNLREWWKTLDNAIYPLINDPDLSGDKVNNTIHSLIGHPNSELNGGIFSPETAIQAAKEFYGPDGQMLPPAQMRKKLALFHTKVVGNLQSSEYVPVGVDKDGRQIYMTRSGAILNDAMMPRAGDTPQGPGAVPRQPPPGGGNNLPVSPPAQPGETPQPAPSGPAAVPWSLPPGQKEAADVTGQASGTQLAADRAANSNYRREVLPLEQAIPSLERLGAQGTGPGADEFNQLKSFLTFVGADKMLGIDPSKIKDFTEAKKYLTDWVMATGSTGTNDKLLAAFNSNANVGINQAAAVDVARMALAIRRMKAAQTAEFEKTGLPESQYVKWAAKWNRDQDPRAFGADLIDPKQLDKVVKGMSAAELPKFLKSLRIAHENELTSPRSGWQTSP